MDQDPDDVPRPLTDQEFRILKAEIKSRTVHVGQRIYGTKAWQVVEFILLNVERIAGPDLDYAIRYCERTADEYDCADQVVSTAIRGVCMMYQVPFVLPRKLWERELYRVRFSSWYSIRRVRQIQEKFPWAVPDLPTDEHGVPTSLDVLNSSLKVGRRKNGETEINPTVVQILINYHEASYWMFRFWHEELIAMRPEEYREMRALKMKKGGKGRNARYSDIHEKDKIQVGPLLMARLLRTSTR